jgi:WD40 repeat protein
MITNHIWDVTTGKLLSPPLEPKEEIVTLSSDGSRAVTAVYQGVRVWNVIAGKPLSPRIEILETVSSIAFSPDGTRVLAAGGLMDERFGIVRVWNATTGKQVIDLNERSFVYVAKFSPDGKRIAAVYRDDGKARVWNASTGEPISPPFSHGSQSPPEIEFCSDGARLVTMGDDKTARVWDASTGKPLFVLEHQSNVTSTAFSRDGAYIVTRSHELPSPDHTARVWDATTGKPLTAPIEQVESALFSPDGTNIVIIYGGTGATARLLEMRADNGPLADWAAIAEHGPYVLDNGVLAPRPPPAPGPVPAR